MWLWLERARAAPRRPTVCADADRRCCCSTPGSVGTVTFAPGERLAGNEPLLVSGSRGLGPAVTDGRRWMEAYHHVRGIGGTTLHFTGESHRLHPDAMKMKTASGSRRIGRSIMPPSSHTTSRPRS